jgi:hypothetical protein
VELDKSTYKEYNLEMQKKMKNSIINMKRSLFVSAMMIGLFASAGNEDRVGSSGASMLLVNPWARSSALGDANIANAKGLEASYLNIAGLAFTDKTQLKFNTANWMGSAGIQFYSAGIAQRISDDGVLTVSVQSMNYGDIDVTTVNIPEGGIGTFSPRTNIVNVGYAKAFSSSIYAGINLKVLSESIFNVRGNGVAIDAGIQYVTGEQDQMKFGITLKNVGPTIKYKGDGFTLQANNAETSALTSLDQRIQAYELPSLLGIGGSYDFNFDEKSKFGYTANSFFYDQFRLGANYGMNLDKFAFNLRAGFVYEKNLFSAENRSNAMVGPTAGFSVDALVGKNQTALGVEYSSRFAGAFGIVHTFGITIDLK